MTTVLMGGVPLITDKVVSVLYEREFRSQSLQILLK
jgi:hypothetical protein